MIGSSRLGEVVRHVGLVLGAALFAVPLYLTVDAASHDARSLLGGIPLSPGGQLEANLGQVITTGLPNTAPLHTMLLNSAIMALGITLGKLLISIPTSFAVVYFRFPGRMFAFWLILFTLLLPVELRFFPTYQVTASLHLLNSFPGLILPLMASATATFVFRQVFMTIPTDLVDAARVDGIGPIRFLTSILLPLSKANLGAIFVLEFVYGWNQYLWPLLITSGPEHATVVMGIQSMISAAHSFAVPEWNLVMASALLALAPPVVVVLVMQRWFVKGLTAGIT